jgi:MoxR-like ATPase
VVGYIKVTFNLLHYEDTVSVLDKLQIYAENNLNVLLIGPHGIGKTTMVMQIADTLGVKLKYYSASTLDPWADLVGIPKPVEETESLKYYRPQDLEEAEFVFFDELNRAHPRVLNAVLEIIQFKRINGKPLKNLRMVWAAINPPGEDYDVEDLDPALMDRFHTYLNLKAEFNMEYMQSKMSEDTAKVLRAWWREDMDDKQRRLITPRRLEYIGMLIDKDIDWKEALPVSTTTVLPDGHLRRRLKALKFGESGVMDITKENILNNPDVFKERVAQDPSEAIAIREVVMKFAPRDIFVTRDLLESLPKDLVLSVGRGKFAKIRREIYNLFKENKVNINHYPKISQAYKLDEYVENAS